MPATATNFDGTKIVLGPGKLWANVAVPAAGARITLFTDGSPDSTANPNAKHLGLTASGGSVMFKQEIQEFESDEDTAPHLTKVIKEPVAIKAELLQVADLTDILQYVWPGGNYSTAAGYKQIAFGGTDSITYYSFVLIAPSVADPTKFIVSHLYKAYNAGGIELNITRRDQSKVPIELKALSISTRAVGDKIGNFWIQI